MDRCAFCENDLSAVAALRRVFESNASGLFSFRQKSLHILADDIELQVDGRTWLELMKAGAPCLHYYTMSNAEITCRIAEKVF